MSKTILVSGASSGIGYDIATYFHELGFDVIGLSRKYPVKDYKFKYILCDITNEQQVKEAISQIEELDILVNCAGMGISGAVEYTTYEEVKKIHEVNVYGTFLMSRECIPLLRNNKGSKIINIGSVAGELAIPFQTFYSMTKASIQLYTEGLANELKPFGIKVSCVLPGDTKTEFTKNRVQPNVVENELYKTRIKDSIEQMERDEQNGMPVRSVTKVVHKVIKQKNPPLMKTVGIQYKFFVLLKKILPKRFVNFVLYKMYG
jgi:short-subunit dehydrogenase